MERLVDEDVRCCANCSRCMLVWGDHKGGVFCDITEGIIWKYITDRECKNFSKGKPYDISFDDAPDLVKARINAYARS